MSTPMTADQELAAFKKWQCRIKEYSGWRIRSRPGGLKSARGVVVHHTGSSSQTDDYLNFLFVRGRPEEGIPGPLCNVSTDMDGDLHVGAYGRANHAGSGSLRTLDAVTSENYDGYNKELEPGSDQSVNGNDYYYGNEIRYTGGSKMSDAAYRTALLHAAAIVDFYDWSPLSVIGHKEHTSRKNDPGSCPMYIFRRDLRAVLLHGPGQGTPDAPPLGTAQDLTMTAYAIWFGSTQPRPMNRTDKVWQDLYQFMEFAANPKIGVITVAQRDWWVIFTTDPDKLDWAQANEMVLVTLKKLQAHWGIPVTGIMDARTEAWFRGYGYTII
jgi:hypothetical protein